MPSSVAARWTGWARTHANSPGPMQAGRVLVGLPPPPVEIPFGWLATPLGRKPTTPVTQAQVTQLGGTTAYSTASSALLRQYGSNGTPITLTTAVAADAQALADMLTTYQATPRPRQPTLTFNLLSRSDEEILLILSVTLARRVRLTGCPPGTPPGAANFVVEGISHVAAVDQRTVTWSTAALIGQSTSEPGPWFRLGHSSLGGSDVVPF